MTEQPTITSEEEAQRRKERRTWGQVLMIAAWFIFLGTWLVAGWLSSEATLGRGTGPSLAVVLTIIGFAIAIFLGGLALYYHD